MTYYSFVIKNINENGKNAMVVEEYDEINNENTPLIQYLCIDNLELNIYKCYINKRHLGGDIYNIYFAELINVNNKTIIESLFYGYHKINQSFIYYKLENYEIIPKVSFKNTKDEIGIFEDFKEIIQNQKKQENEWNYEKWKKEKKIFKK